MASTHPVRRSWRRDRTRREVAHGGGILKRKRTLRRWDAEEVLLQDLAPLPDMGVF